MMQHVHPQHARARATRHHGPTLPLRVGTRGSPLALYQTRHFLDLIRAVRDNHEIVELRGEIRVRQTKFQGNFMIEIIPSTSEQIRELRETALINIVQTGRNRFFLPTDEKRAPETLEKVLKAFPPVLSDKNDGEAFNAPNTLPVNINPTPVVLPDWLIEPPESEVEKISSRN